MQSFVTGTLQDSFAYRLVSSRGTKHAQSQSSCTARLLFTQVTGMDTSSTRLEGDSHHASVMHPNYPLWIYTHRSPTSSQPSRQLWHTYVLHKATTAHSSGLLHLLPSLYREGVLGWRSERCIVLLRSHSALFQKFCYTNDMLATLLCDQGVKAEQAAIP